MSASLLLQSVLLFLTLGNSPGVAGQGAPGIEGYYRTPAISRDSIVFTSEGDLWRVGLAGGLAQRLTTHPSTETFPAISPDGKWLAFSASYEGPTEAYVMPIDGGLPERCTYTGTGVEVVGWTQDGKILFSTGKYSTLPSAKLCTVDPKTLKQSILPLAQAHDGVFSDDGKVLFFTRLSFQGSQTKRYKGGTAQNIWRWDGGETEAKPLTADYTGTSRSPMVWKGRVYFVTDRDGVMNIWSMTADGHELKRLTKYTDYDVQSPKLGDGRIVYQHGADLCTLDIASGLYAKVPIRLMSDFDQMRERWVKNPMQWVTSAHISPDGSKVAMTARGEVFVAPVKQGRLVETTRNKNVRYRDARFSHDGKSLIALSDQSGEVELWSLDPMGTAEHAPEQLTHNGQIVRWQTLPSPDGKWIAHTDKNHFLHLLDVTTKVDKPIAESDQDDINDLTWSPDSHYLAFSQVAENTNTVIKLYVIASGKTFDATTDRYNNGVPAFTDDGKFMYFLSDRHLTSSVSSPWGPRAPEPYFDKEMGVFFLSLQRGLRSPFQPDDELVPEKKEPEKTKSPLPTVDTNGLEARLFVAPIPPGNYSDLRICGNRLYFRSAPPGGEGPSSLVSVAIKNQNIKVDNILANVAGFETTPDGKKILAMTGQNLVVFDANGMPPDAGESRVNLDGWTFSFDPKEEWRQMFEDAWRLHRDYLYASNMQGVDWAAMRKKYRPLVDRVTDRTELSDILAQMMGEVSLLHTFVTAGDRRTGSDDIEVASLGAIWDRESAAGGYRLTKLYHTDPDTPEISGPLLKPGIDLRIGDVIAEIDGIPTLSVPNADALLRAKVGGQVRIRVYIQGDKSKTKEAIVLPISVGAEGNLKYSDWEYSRRIAVESMGDGKLGYVHLRAMGSGDIDQWARDFYPVFDREGLIVDVRHNNGGNIDSWILEKLMRKAWMYWNQHKGKESWNMQYAFRGQIVVLCDENTASDGEAFTEGFRRLGLGKVIGTRTWGGEVWLSGGNTLVDRGVATAAESGVYGPEGKWLIEGHGVEPDIMIDNLPHETFLGADAQLAMAVKVLKEEIAKHPNPVPSHPEFPDKSFPPKKTR